MRKDELELLKRKREKMDFLTLMKQDLLKTYLGFVNTVCHVDETRRIEGEYRTVPEAYAFIGEPEKAREIWEQMGTINRELLTREELNHKIVNRLKENVKHNEIPVKEHEYTLKYANELAQIDRPFMESIVGTQLVGKNETNKQREKQFVKSFSQSRNNKEK